MPLRVPQLPSALIGAIATLPDVLKRVGSMQRLSRAETEQVVSLVPEPIKNSPCFLDRLTGLWRYEFGLPIDDLPDTGVVLGTQMFKPVEQLFDVLRCALARLPNEQLMTYLKRLEDPQKHEDLLNEFAPVARLPAEVGVQYEVSGYGPGATSVDWLIMPPKRTPLLLDVKNRTRDLIEGLEQIGRGARDPDGRGPAPVHEHGLLFRSIESKFSPRKTSEILQGAWVFTYLKQEESELHQAFSELDRERVHFAILGDWKSDGYILAVDDSTRTTLAELFSLQESRRFVFTRAD